MTLAQLVTVMNAIWWLCLFGERIRDMLLYDHDSVV
jgi:hypothetical protein